MFNNDCFFVPTQASPGAQFSRIDQGKPGAAKPHPRFVFHRRDRRGRREGGRGEKLDRDRSIAFVRMHSMSLDAWCSQREIGRLIRR